MDAGQCQMKRTGKTNLNISVVSDFVIAACYVLIPLYTASARFSSSHLRQEIALAPVLLRSGGYVYYFSYYCY
jgi:hypothetical protein